MVAIFPHLNCIQNPQILYLVVADPLNERKCLLLLVWLYASYEMNVWIQGYFVYQGRNFPPYFVPQKLLISFSFHSLVLLCEFYLDYVRFWFRELLSNILLQEVFIFASESFNQILYLARGVLNNEDFFGCDIIRGWKMFMSFTIFFHIGQVIFIPSLKGAASIKQIVDTVGWAIQ